MSITYWGGGTGGRSDSGGFSLIGGFSDSSFLSVDLHVEEMYFTLETLILAGAPSLLVAPVAVEAPGVSPDTAVVPVISTSCPT